MKKKKRKAGEDRNRPRTRAYPVEFRLRIVKLFQEEGYSVALISEEFGISHHSIRRWVRAYRRGGVDGLTPKPRPGGKPCVKPEIQERVIAVKKTRNLRSTIILNHLPLYDLNRGIHRGTDLRYCSYFFPNVFSK
jgi:transposase